MTAPDLLPPLPEHRRLRVERLRSLSRLLDRAITVPGTKIGVGLDPILGVLTGGGDIFTGLLSAYIIWEAAEMGVPRSTLLRMLRNIGLDLLVGIVPVLGDVFDLVWQANVRNMALLDQHVAQPETSQRSDRGFALAIVALIVVLVVGVAAVSLWIVAMLFQLLVNG